MTEPRVSVSHARARRGAAARSRIGDWIDAQQPAVPASFRARLQAEGPASPAGFAAAATEALAAMRHPGGPAPEGDREAAFSLLAADAYLTYACLLALREDDAPAALEEIAATAARQWPPAAPPPAGRRSPGPAPKRAS